MDTEQSIWGIWMRANEPSIDHRFPVGLSMVEQKDYERREKQWLLEAVKKYIEEQKKV